MWLVYCELQIVYLDNNVKCKVTIRRQRERERERDEWLDLSCYNSTISVLAATGRVVAQRD
jgi:hypothetical protein